MNFRTTVILLVCLVGAVIFLFFANQSGDPEKPKAPKPEDEKGRLVLDVKADDLNKVVIRPGAGAPAEAKLIELGKGDKGWNIVQPINWPGDSFEAGNLIRLVAEARSSGSVDVTDANRNATGLGKPRFVIELTDTKGKTSKLTVGERSALGQLYVAAGDDLGTASLVTGGQLADRLGQSTNKLIASIRDKQLLRVTPMDVKQAKIEAGPRSLAMSRAGTGTDWKITAPTEVPGDGSEVSDILSTVTTLRGEEFVDEAVANSSGASFDRPRAVVTLNTATPTTQPAAAPAGKTITITVGQAVDIEGEKSWVRISDPPSVAKVSLGKTSLDKITGATPTTLRDRKLFDLKPEDVSEVTVSIEKPSTTQPTTNPSEQKTIKIGRRKDNLQLGPAFPMPPGGAGPASQPVTQPAVPATQPAVAPATQPAATASPCHNSETTPVVFADEQAIFPTALLASPDTLPTTLPDTTGPSTTQPVAIVPTTGPVASTQVLATQPSTTQPVIILPPPVEPVVEKPKSKWVLESEANAAADDGQVTDLLSDLHPLKAMKYLDKVPPATQPTTVTYLVTVKTIAAGGGQTGSYEIRITDAGGTSQPVATYGGLTFEIDRAFIRKLEGDFKTPKADNTPMQPPMMSPSGFPPGMMPPGHP